VLRFFLFLLEEFGRCHEVSQQRQQQHCHCHQDQEIPLFEAAENQVFACRRLHGSSIGLDGSGPFTGSRGLLPHPRGTDPIRAGALLFELPERTLELCGRAETITALLRHGLQDDACQHRRNQRVQ